MNLKPLLLAVSALFFADISTLGAVDLGFKAGYTPYDRYMSPVKQVLGSLHGQNSDFKRVQQLLRLGRGFRYSFTDPYTAALPAVTAQTRAGDCKAKSLWLVDQLGDANVRYVIGRARANSRISHAWVIWNDGRAWWILDPTNTSRPIPADSISSKEYIPLYSWAKNGSFRHSASAEKVAAVAGKSRSAPSATGEHR